MGRYFPKSLAPRQGKRQRDRWGPCNECGEPTAMRCAECHAWRCGQYCGRLRAVPKAIGLYRFRCSPKCRLRMRSEVAARIRGKTRAGRGA